MNNILDIFSSLINKGFESYLTFLFFIILLKLRDLNSSHSVSNIIRSALKQFD